MSRTGIGAFLGLAALVGVATPSLAETTLTIGTVNNSDMIRMQGLTGDFSAKNPDITVKWVTLEENALRQRVTTDIATKGGQFDILTIGTYEVPIWAKQKWLVPLDKLGADYDVNDILPKIRAALSVGSTLYAAPFYGESSMVMYRKDLFAKAGLTMPEQPSWDFVIDAAKKLTDKSAEVYGICLRGKAGWGENMAFLDSMANSYGARLFDEKWQPQFNSAEWHQTLGTYVDVMKAAGPPGASSNGFNENLALFDAGKCAMWIDATVAASMVTNPKDSKVADNVGFALAPNTGLGKNANWLWAWSLAIPAGSKKVDAAEKFVAWATSKGYTELVAAKEGWASVPPGTRTSLYQNPEYLKAAPFAKLTLASIDMADPDHPTVKPVPYVGIQYAAIPEFQGIGTAVGQQFSAALSGATTVDAALAAAQSSTEREMKRAGYIK
jgi:sorbitol/mannitol transport system substrate-binding protein